MTKKPKILKAKIELANLIRKTWQHSYLFVHCRGTYWEGEFPRCFEGYDIRIFFQYYVKRRGVVDYVSITNAKNSHKALSVKEIKDLLNRTKEFLNIKK